MRSATESPSLVARHPRTLAFAAAALAAGIAVAATSIFLAAVAPPASAAPPAQAFAWEYRVITGRRTIQNRDTRALRDGALNEFTQWNLILNEIGAEGWELVAVLGGPGDSQKEYVFKRPR